MSKGDTFGERLKKLRLLKSETEGRTLTQEIVAEEIGVRYATYNSWENNKTFPRRMNDWCKLADYFNVTIDYLIRGDAGSCNYVSLQKHQYGNLTWKLNKNIISDRHVRAVKVFELCARGESDANIMNIMRIDESNLEDLLFDVTRDGLIEILDVKRDNELENALMERYGDYPGIIEARVFAVGKTNPIFNRLLVSWGAKEYLIEELKKPFASRMLIGIAGGTTLANMFRLIKRGECPHTSVCPLAVSPAEVAIGVDPNTIIGDLAYRHQNYIDAFTMPYVSYKTMETFSNAKEVPPEVLAAKRILGKAENVDMAFISVGALDDVMAYMMTEFFRAAGGMTIDEIRKKAVGDILYHIVDKNGNIVDEKYDKFLCSIELSVLKDMVREGKRVVLVTHSGRTEISKVVIEQRMVNVIITDDVLARSLLT